MRDYSNLFIANKCISSFFAYILRITLAFIIYYLTASIHLDDLYLNPSLGQ